MFPSLDIPLSIPQIMLFPIWTIPTLSCLLLPWWPVLCYQATTLMDVLNPALSFSAFIHQQILWLYLEIHPESDHIWNLISFHHLYCYQLVRFQMYLKVESKDLLMIIGSEAPCLPGLSSVQFSHSVVSESLQPHGLQHARPPCPSPTPGVYSNSCPLSQWCHPTISSSVAPSPPTFNLSQHQGLFKWVSSLHQVSKVLEFQLQHQSFQWIFRTDFL